MVATDQMASSEPFLAPIVLSGVTLESWERSYGGKQRETVCPLFGEAVLWGFETVIKLKL